MRERAIRVTPLAALHEDELEWRFVRAGGPGGQHVNKVATAVELRFDLGRARGLPAQMRERLRRLAGRRLSKEGVIVIEARRFRSQERNRDDALARLVALVRRAAEPPKPRVPTRPPAAARRARLDDKRRRKRRKALRTAPGPDE